MDTRSLSANEPPTDYAALRGDINWIVRLNHGYGSTGTIPLPGQYQEFANACANYVAQSRGANIWIIGNEPNHEQERPNGTYITPGLYAQCFALCRNAIKRVNPNAQVIPAPCAPYHANPSKWTDYLTDMLGYIAKSGGCDGIAVHTYTRSSNPADIESGAQMGPPLQNTYSGFLSYLDALDCVPSSMLHLPVYITEFNELLEHGWDDANAGVVQAAYHEINDINQGSIERNLPIQCLILYRWPKYDKWHIEGKRGVIDDFYAAVSKGYLSPIRETNAVTETLHIPQVSPGTTPTEPSLPPRNISEDFKRRIEEISYVNPYPGQRYYRLVTAEYVPNGAQRFGPDHHILVEVLGVDGKRKMGEKVVFFTDEKKEPKPVDKQSGPYGVDYPMFAHGHSYGVFVGDKVSNSDAAVGMGLGTIEQPDWNHHVTYYLVFQEVIGQAATPPSEAPTPAEPVAVPQLAHPIADPALRVVSQVFGANPERYARFGLKGHNGVDFAVPTGMPVLSVDTGHVVEARMDEDGYGLYVKLRHAWGESLYAHLSELSFDIKPGSAVPENYYLGRSGNSGNSTGPHLHFGIRVNPYTRGAPFDGYSDPLPYLSGATQNKGSDYILAAIKEAAADVGVEWELLASLAWAESSWNPRAISAAGAKGVMQIMPATWAEWSAKVNFGSDPFDAVENIEVGAAYLAWCIANTNGIFDALHAYNWGIGNVMARREPPAETVEYARKVVHGRDLLKAVGG